ncbi:MAG TPA: TetR/AcrR family transcriptional regulator [Vicinamibacterales bacterium]|nr:TetR/AcrR family transcriptional regulator [Vicinamibacterales bacterium]
MSPRPRTIADEKIIAAAAKVIGRVGPGNLTLADVGKEAGLSAATLVQRFGSKRGLLLAMATSAAGSMDACFDMVRAAHPSPLAALVAAATDITRYFDTPAEVANHLAFLQMDLSDPDFHRLMVISSKKTLEGYRRLLREAADAGELVECDTQRLARAITAVCGGSLIQWAVFRQGTAVAWVRGDVDAVLEPYRANSPRSARTTRRVARKASRQKRS